MQKVVKAIFFGIRPVVTEVGLRFLSFLALVTLIVIAIGFLYLACLGAVWCAGVLWSIDIQAGFWGVQLVNLGPWGAALDALIIILAIGHAAYTEGLKELQFRESLRNSNDSKHSEDISA